MILGILFISTDKKKDFGVCIWSQKKLRFLNINAVRKHSNKEGENTLNNHQLIRINFNDAIGEFWLKQIIGQI